MIAVKFSHKELGFSTYAVLAAAGIGPQHGTIYQQLFLQVQKIIEGQVLITAQRLNELLKDQFHRDMGEIPEYADYPPYFDVLDNALSNPRNVGYYWDDRGLIQAKFIDLVAMGGLRELQEIQKMVHPGGTLRGWIGIYKSWKAGTSKKYEDIVNHRLAIMRTMGSAPFIECIELGNGHYAYPRNERKQTITKFVPVYQSEMKAAYARVLSMVKALVTNRIGVMYGYMATTVETPQGITHSGFEWSTPSGRRIFVISGTTRLDVSSNLIGKGFILDTAGNIMSKWAGRVPR